MAFKLGKENRKNTYGSGKNRFDKDDASVPGTPILRKDLEKGIMAEANIDGSIFISKKGKINYNGEWLPEGSTAFPWERH